MKIESVWVDEALRALLDIGLQVQLYYHMKCDNNHNIN